MASVSEILLEQARQAGDARRERGARTGQLVAGLTQIPGQIMAARQQAHMQRALASQQGAEQQRVIDRDTATARRGDETLALDREKFTAEQTSAKATQAAKDAVERLKATGGDPVLFQAWVSRDAPALFAPEALPRLQEIATDPEQIKSFTATLLNGPAKPVTPKFSSVVAGGGVLDENTGTVTPGLPKPPEPDKPVTFSQPQPLMVGGKRRVVRAGSDGKMYDVNTNQPVVGDVGPDVPPVNGQQERAGYFTMTPVYDAQGRPVGAMKLNARTGEMEFVNPEALGGALKPPPGTLGADTIRSEASLDSLQRLKAMFDAGAKNDIGPGEGRLRSGAQKVPGGVAVMKATGQDVKRFADFDAASKGFQNAMIKAITGAQMSEPEAKRIMGQIPSTTDAPDVWEAKYAQSVKNLQDIERRTRTDRDATATAKPDPLGLR